MAFAIGLFVVYLLLLSSPYENLTTGDNNNLREIMAESSSSSLTSKQQVSAGGGATNNTSSTSTTVTKPSPRAIESTILDTNANNATTTTPWKYFPWKLPESGHKQDVDEDEYNNVAIFMISMGQSAAKFRIVERVWLSLRRKGDFFGPMVVLTDAPPDRYLGILDADPNFYPILPKTEHYNFDSAFTDLAMPYKRFKTYLIDYLAEANLEGVDYILYVDADVVIGQPLTSWIKYSKQKLGIPRPALSSKPSIIFFEGNYEDMPIQSGQFAMSARTAQPCLQRWRQIIDTHPAWDKDQYSLKLLHVEIASASSTHNCHFDIIPQESWLVFVKKENIRGYLQHKNYTTFMHIQNTGHARYMNEGVVQKFFTQLLELTKEEQTLNWKTPIRPSIDWSKEQVIH